MPTGAAGTRGQSQSAHTEAASPETRQYGRSIRLVVSVCVRAKHVSEGTDEWRIVTAHHVSPEQPNTATHTGRRERRPQHIARSRHNVSLEAYSDENSHLWSVGTSPASSP